MPILVHCPHCGAQTQAPDSMAGQSGPCRECGQMLTVPGGFGAGTGAGAARTTGSSSSTVWIIVIVVVAVLLLLFGLVMLLLYPAWGAAQGAAQRAECANNLKQIALAMHNYHDTFGHFPPAYKADENGRPMHSWRVLILPFIEEQGTYELYDMDQPWDSPQNRALASRMPLVYTCPSERDQTFANKTTSYVMVTAPTAIFDGPQETDFSAITDGRSNTILVVEAHGTNIPWMEPRDLPADSANLQQLMQAHPGGFNVAMADASVRFLKPEEMPDGTFQALLTRNGGEVVEFP